MFLLAVAGTTLFAFLYSAVCVRDQKTHARMLGWRVNAQAGTCFAVLLGFALHNYYENKWIREQAAARNLFISEKELPRDVIWEMMEYKRKLFNTNSK